MSYSYHLAVLPNAYQLAVNAGLPGCRLPLPVTVAVTIRLPAYPPLTAGFSLPAYGKR